MVVIMGASSGGRAVMPCVHLQPYHSLPLCLEGDDDDDKRSQVMAESSLDWFAWFDLLAVASVVIPTIPTTTTECKV